MAPGIWVGSQAVLHPACHPATHPCPARHPFRKHKGGGQQCFVFLYKTNDVSQTHEPHHTTHFVTIASTNNNSANVTTKYSCGGPMPTPMPMPMPMPKPRNARAGHQLCPDLRKPPLLSCVYMLPTWSSAVCCLRYSTVPNPKVPQVPRLNLVSIHKALRSVLKTLHSRRPPPPHGK